ncbi:MAG: deoxyguanosinetriphosphate triphosphohydrolase [Rhizobiaceae bacterium]|jgi:dGTPase|nr:deoxyguanosinetriphosphate triphosphohydrolase [Rhizobiaceae bacterium]
MAPEKHPFQGLIGFGHQPRAAYACDPAASMGRLIAEAPSPTRTEFQRDRDRIIHSTAFRRLKHKTQVFLEHESDHYRTRLTHTLEVAQIARGLARALRVDEDLTEAIALVHDFGHTPFGHAGERALNRIMAGQGGFDHNAQALRIVTELEQVYARFGGLNLTFETLEGLVKHNGPLGRQGDVIPQPILAFDAVMPLGLDGFAPLEAQCAAIADDIAYDAHDIDDGMRSGILTMAELLDAPVVGPICHEVRALYPDVPDLRLVHEVTRRQITVMVEDVLRTALTAIGAHGPRSAADVRTAPAALVTFSEPMRQAEAELKRFLFGHLYRHPDVMSRMSEAEHVVEALFARYRDEPHEIGGFASHAPHPTTERRVADYIAGMTDRFALREYRRLFDRTADLV